MCDCADGTGSSRHLLERVVKPPLRLHQGRLRHFGRVLKAIGQACDPTVDVPQQLLAISQGGTRRIEGLFDAIGQRCDAAIDTRHQLLEGGQVVIEGAQDGEHLGGVHQLIEALHGPQQVGEELVEGQLLDPLKEALGCGGRLGEGRGNRRDLWHVTLAADQPRRGAGMEAEFHEQLAGHKTLGL
jgi:hypothetical protein